MGDRNNDASGTFVVARCRSILVFTVRPCLCVYIERKREREGERVRFISYFCVLHEAWTLLWAAQDGLVGGVSELFRASG